MYKQIKHMATWGRRKTMLLFALLFSVTLIFFSVNHFSQQNRRLEMELEKYPSIPAQTTDAGNSLAYSGTGAAIFLIIAVFLLLLREIRMRRKIYEELRLQKEHYRITINSIAEGLITTGREGEILYMNPSAERITGWKIHEVKNLPLEKVYDVVNEETGQNFEHIVKRILKNKELVEFENNTILHTKHSHKLIISNSGSPLFDSKKNITGTVLVFNDITEKKRIENELKQSEKQYRTLIQHLPEAVYTCDALGNIQLYNNAAVALWGREPVAGQDQWCGSLKAYHSDGTPLQLDNCPMAIAIKEKRPVYGHAIIVERPDGSLRHVLPYPSPLFDESGSLTGAINMLIDVTEKREKEILVKQTEAFSTGILDSLSSHIAVINASGTIIKTNASWNNHALSNGGDLPEKCGEGSNYFEVCTTASNRGDDFSERALAGMYQVLDGTLNEFYLEYPCHSPTQQKWFFMRVLKFESTEPLLVIEHNDITERRKAELETLTAVERYDILAKATSDTIWDWDIVNNRMLYNPGITNMFGYQLSEVADVFNWWKEQIHPDDLEFVTTSYIGVTKTVTPTMQLEYRFRCANGDYKYIYDRAFVIYDTSQRPVRMIGAMQDITSTKEEEKRMAKAIIDAQEQERRYLGQELHDNVNQLLAGSLLSLGMIKHHQANPLKIIEFCNLTKGHVLTALDEIRKLSHHLAPAAFDDSTLKDNFQSLLETINVNNQFAIQFHFDDRINTSQDEAIQINLYRIVQEQVKNILNYSGAKRIEIAVIQSDDAVRMRIFDDGRGFDPQTVKRGIGLGNMKKRVDALGGKFILNSRPGNGCEIIVEIPSRGKTGCIDA
jgi:two-component system sensor histidine kinase UhpB